MDYALYVVVGAVAAVNIFALVAVAISASHDRSPDPGRRPQKPGQRASR
jgi:hypothetical protein